MTSAPDRTVETWSRLVELKERLLGLNDIEIVGTLVLRGLAQQAAREWSDAIRSLERAITIVEKTEGRDSLTAIDCKRQFWVSYLMLGRYDDLEEFGRKRYEVYQREHMGGLNLMVIVAHREWARWLGEMGRDADALIELDRVLVEISEIGHDDPIETIRAQLEIVELRAARGESALAEPLALVILDALGTDERLFWERQRARVALVEGQIQRRELDDAEFTISELARHRPPTEPGYYTIQQVEKRIVRRWLEAYRSAGMPEPPAFDSLRRAFSIDDR
jgi:hypothetical protein